jgi:hypothetical protein
MSASPRCYLSALSARWSLETEMSLFRRGVDRIQVVLDSDRLF